MNHAFLSSPPQARGSGMETLTFNRPMDSRLEHVDFSLLFSTLSQRKIIQLFSSLLMERRVIFTATSLSLTTGCAHALMALLYPFEWQVSPRSMPRSHHCYWLMHACTYVIPFPITCFCSISIQICLIIIRTEIYLCLPCPLLCSY